jgi:pSer/pThr/pTyr-binding forkhead associated (FHA) protein
MARLVLLSEGYTGRTFDLKVEQTTVGRVSDNAIEIPDGSVSSHHGEFLLRGSEVVFRDLGSTNGSFIGNQQITEATLKHGQVLRLGQIEMRFESAEAAPSRSPQKPPANTSVIPAGINREQLSNTGGNVKTSEFKKKSNKSTIWFLVLLGGVALILIAILVMLVMQPGK